MSDSEAGSELARISSTVQACERCALHQSATHGVPGEGPATATVMLVGEGPGLNEDKQGRPFVGAAGKFLDQTLLPLAGLKRSEVYITNVVKHRPPNNRDPMPDELAACLPYLEQQIAIVNPRLIVTLGRFSLGTFFPGEMISKVHGQVEDQGRSLFLSHVSSGRSAPSGAASPDAGTGHETTGRLHSRHNEPGSSSTGAGRRYTAGTAHALLIERSYTCVYFFGKGSLQSGETKTPHYPARRRRRDREEYDHFRVRERDHRGRLRRHVPGGEYARHRSGDPRHVVSAAEAAEGEGILHHARS